MYIIRPVRLDDLNQLEELASGTGLGMLSLPKDRSLLKHKIERSIASFNRKVSQPQDEIYLFILENIITGELGGTSSIYAKMGCIEPEYFYRIETVSTPREMKVLHTHLEVNGPSELCGLYLKHTLRKEHLGELLSLSRLLFVASFPERFEANICARLRGVITENNSSPFWDGLGRHFLNMNFKEAYQYLITNPQSIPKILPKYPVYVNLLLKKAQKVLQKTHRNTKPALKMLKRERFQLIPYIDVFDAGPVIQAETVKIRTIKNCRRATVDKINEESTQHHSIVSNDRLDFLSCYGNVHTLKNGNITLSKEVSKRLGVSVGDSVRYRLL